MGQNDVEMEDAGNNIEDSKGEAVDAEVESKAEKSPSAVTVADNVNKSGRGVEDLNNLTNEAKDTTTTKREMENQTNPESKTRKPMNVEASTGGQINDESKNEEKISTKSNVEEQNATRSTLERQTNATNEVVEFEQNTSYCEVKEEKLPDGVKGESSVKLVREENPSVDAAAEIPKEMKNENADTRSDPTESRQFPTEISSKEALQSQNAALDAVPQGEDKEMKDTSKENEDKSVHHDPKEQAKEVLLSSPVAGGDGKTVETETKQKIDESSLPNQHEAVTPSSLVRYPPAKAEDHSGEVVKAPFTQAALPLMAEDDDGTPEDQAAFMKEIETFYRERGMDFKPPKFYGQPLNCLKLWRAVLRLGGYDRVTGSKLWRQVGESFHPPKTCTTVSWTFRIFYEKSLLEYERHKRQSGELQLPLAMLPEASGADSEGNGYQGPGSGRARRDAAARAMQGWHVQRLFDNGEVGEPVIKDKNLNSLAKREKNVKSIGTLKQKRPNEAEQSVKASRTETSKQLVTSVVDVGPPADWVKINVRQAKDCFEVYALVPGLLREEVRVQSDPAGRLVITGQPEQVDNPWGITPFKKVVNLPSRIDPLQTSAVVSLHGRLFVRVPLEQSNS